jgi:hypothetical protein
MLPHQPELFHYPALQGRRKLYKTLQDATEAWLKHPRSQYGANNSIVSGSNRVVNYLHEIFDPVRSHLQVTQIVLQEWVDRLLVAGYEPGTLHGYRQHISSIFEWLGGANPAAELEIPESVSKDKFAWVQESDREAIRQVAREIDAMASDGFPRA